MAAKSFLVSRLAVVAVGRLTFTLLRFTMLKLTSIKLARRKNMMSMSGMISMRASDSAEGFGLSLTGMGFLGWGLPGGGGGRGGPRRGRRAQRPLAGERFHVVPVMLGGLDEHFGVVDGAFEAGPELGQLAV